MRRRISLGVSEADDQEDAEEVSILHLDPVFFVQLLGHLVAGGAQACALDGQLGLIQVVDAGLADAFAAEAVQAFDLVHLFPGLAGQLQGPAQQAGAIQGHLAAGHVDGRHQDVAGRGGGQQLQHLADPAFVDAVPAHVQERGLGHAGQDLVGALHAHVRAALHRAQGQLIAELQVGPMGLVHQQGQAALMHQLGDAGGVRGDAVVGGGGDEDGLHLRPALQGRLHGPHRDIAVEGQVAVDLGLEEDRLAARQQHARQDALVGVARD
jgi:hypothetical protein